MLVDDDEDDIEIFKNAIQSVDQTIDCYIARDGEEAMNLLEQVKNLPHIIFLDINMPRVNGLQCLHQIKSDPKLVHIPVYIYTTTTRQDSGQMLKMGAESVIVKPSSFNDICAIIRMALMRTTASSGKPNL